MKAFASEFKSELDQANFETKLKIILYLVRGIKMDYDDVYIVFRFQEAAMEMQKKMVNIIIGSQCRGTGMTLLGYSDDIIRLLG